MTEYQNATLIVQWIGSAASAVSVVVAVIFGWLTLLNTRRSKDNQERSTRTAAAISEQINESIATGIRAAQPGGSATWSVRPAGGEDWFITWVGQNGIMDVRIEGFTELDNRRLGKYGRAAPSDRATQYRSLSCRVFRCRSSRSSLLHPLGFPWPGPRRQVSAS